MRLQGAEVLLVIVVFISSAAALFPGTPTGAYYYDIEDGGGMISAWVGDIVENNTIGCGLIADTKDGRITGDPLLHKIYITNSGGTDIVIDKMNISWHEDNGEKIKRIFIGNELFWSGNAGSGLFDGMDHALKPSETEELKMWFTPDMHGKNFSIWIIMKGCGLKIIEFEAKENPCDFVDGIGNAYGNICGNSLLSYSSSSLAVLPANETIPETGTNNTGNISDASGIANNSVLARILSEGNSSS